MCNGRFRTRTRSRFSNTYEEVTASFGEHIKSSESGDLIIFNGNEIWHMVERGSGGKKRLTVGGFLNTTKEGEVEIWA